MRATYLVGLLAFTAYAGGRLPWYRNKATQSDTAWLRLLKTLPPSGVATGGALTGSRGETVTFARSTTELCDGANGTFKELTADQPCVTAYGYWAYPTSVNKVLRSDAFDNAAWTADNVTVTANSTDVTDPNGGTTSDKLVFAAATGSTAHSTIYQAPTAVGSENNNSGEVFLRTASGTATLWISCTDRSSYWYTRRCDVTSTWASCSFFRAGTCQYFQLGVDRRDAVQPSTGAQTVYAYRAHFEDAPRLGPAMTTAGAAATRGPDTASVAWPARAALNDWCVSATVRPYGAQWTTVSNNTILAAGTATAANSMQLYLDSGALFLKVYDSAGALKTEAIGSSSMFPYKDARIAACNNAGTLKLYNDGVLLASTPTGAGTGLWDALPSTLFVGHYGGGGAPFGGQIGEVCVGQASNKACKQDTARTNTSGLAGDLGPATFNASPIKVATVGDSITAGLQYTWPNPYPAQMQQLLGPGYQVTNYGHGGDTAAQCHTKWTTSVRSTLADDDWVVVYCGVNSIGGGTSAAATWADLEPIIDEAIADGDNVVLVTVAPFHGFTATWTSGKQTELEALNTSIRAKAAATGMPLVDAYALLGDGTDQTALKAEYDSGDHLHPDLQGAWVTAQAAAAKIANAVAMGIPDMRILPLAGYTYTAESGATLQSTSGVNVTTTRAGSRSCGSGTVLANQPCVTGSPLKLDVVASTEKHTIANPWQGVEPTTWCVGITAEQTSWNAMRFWAIANTASGYSGANSAACNTNGSDPSNITCTVVDSTGTPKALNSTGSYNGTHRVVFCDENGTLSLKVDGINASGTIVGSGTGVISTQPDSFWIGHFTNGLSGTGKYNDICLARDTGACL